MVHLTSPRELLRARGKPTALAVFEGMIGQAPCDGPLAVAAEIARRFPSLELVWAGRPDGWTSLPLPELTYVPHGGSAHRLAAARALLTVTSHGAPRFLNAAGVHIQLGHGVPIKKVGYANLGADPASLRLMQRRTRKWNIYPSPSSFYDRAGLRDQGVADDAIVRLPLARYDRLPDFQRQRDVIRSRLGVPDGSPLVVYAPTYRGARDPGDFRPSDLVPSLAAGVEEFAVLGCRMHYLSGLPVDRTSRMVAADSTVVPDALEVVAAADLVVTDYSGVAVDSVVAGTPVVILAPDIDVYARRPGLNANLPAIFEGAFATDVPSAVAAVRAGLSHPRQLLAGPRAWVTRLLGDNAGPRNGAGSLVDYLTPWLEAEVDGGD